MSIRIEEKRGKTTVETDYYDSFGTSHSAVYDDSELRGGMRSFGIEKVEVNGIDDSTDVRGAIHDEFDRQFRERTGRNYFKP
jgi:hypothetical protein